MKVFRPARKRIQVSVGESVRIVRELQGLSQNQLAEMTRISQATISAIENDRVRLGVERAKVLARALTCHPAVLVFPGWESPVESAASPIVAWDARRDRTSIRAERISVLLWE
jgi:transcriptional regulator with XRE-family HTH domain